MKLRMFFQLMTLPLFFTPQISIASGLRCLGGGEGGVPFVTIPNPSYLDWHPLDTAFEVKDLILNGPEKLTYQSVCGNVREFDLNSGADNFLFPGNDTHLSKVLDPNNIFLINDASSAYLWKFDRQLQSKSSLNFPGPDRISKHLFWKAQSLFTAVFKDRASGGTDISIIQTEMRTNHSTLACTFTANEKMGTPGVVIGSSYPKANFYVVPKTEGEEIIHLIEIDVTNCSTQYMRGPEIFSQVRGVYQFPKLQGYAILFAPPQNNLFWWDNLGCKYINTENHHLVVPSTEETFLIGLSPENQLNLFNIEQLTRMPVGKGLRAQSIEERATALNHSQLWVAAKFNEDEVQTLVEINVSKLTSIFPQIRH